MTIRLIFLVIGITYLTGCAVSNEGKVNFRRTDNNNPTISQTDQQNLEVKNYSLGSHSRIEKGDTLSIHLRSAFIHDFTELRALSYITNIGFRQWGKLEGEIAIVANAFELGPDKDFNFADQKEGRVVFYSDNVHKGQLLNFDNMQVYGPIDYKGAPFGFRISIFELDIESKQAKAMLGLIAKAGATAYPPLSPVLPILNDIGDSFLSGEATDTEFRYSMVLDPKSGVDSLNHLSLETGNYVFIRMEDRNKSVPWDELFLDENKGEVFWKEGKGPELIESLESEQKFTGFCDITPCPYTDSSYVVVEINKDVSDVTMNLTNNTYSSLSNTLKKIDEIEATKWDSVKDKLSEVAIRQKQILNFDQAKVILSELSEAEDAGGLSEFPRRLRAVQLFRMMANSVDENGIPLTIKNNDTDNTYDLNKSQVNYILPKLGNIANNLVKTGKIKDPNQLDKLNLINIYSSFNNSLIVSESSKAKELLDLVAPLPSI